MFINSRKIIWTVQKVSLNAKVNFSVKAMSILILLNIETIQSICQQYQLINIEKFDLCKRIFFKNFDTYWIKIHHSFIMKMLKEEKKSVFYPFIFLIQTYFVKVNKEHEKCLWLQKYRYLTIADLISQKLAASNGLKDFPTIKRIK